MAICGLLAIYGLTVAAAAEARRPSPSDTHLSSQYKFAVSGARQEEPGRSKPEAAREEDASADGSEIVTISSGDHSLKKKPQVTPRPLCSPDTLVKKISAKSAVVMDADSKEILFSLAPDLPSQPASTIKVLTGLISIDSLNSRDMVSVSKRASRMPRSKIYLRSDRKYQADDLINAVLLASANDASVALAEEIAGSERVFAKLMTAKAKSFGARNTVCKTANGLTAQGQKTTARDLALIFDGAMRGPSFAEKMSKKKIKCNSGVVVYSHNKALWQINGTVGGKTGYTDLARQTYVGKFRRNNVEMIVAILGSETMWSDVKELVEYGFAKEARLRQASSSEQAPEALSVVKIGRSPGLKTLPLLSGLQ